MAYSFEFREEKIVTDFRFFMFKEFTNIWTKDKSKNKLKANRMLYFIYLLCDLGEDNPIREVEGSKREVEAKYRAYRSREINFTKDDVNLLEPAIKLYVELNMTAEERLLEVFDLKADELSKTLEETIPETVTNEENGVVSYASNSKIITDSLSKLSRIRANREKIVLSIKKQAMSQKVRGGLSLSPLVRGLIKTEM